MRYTVSDIIALVTGPVKLEPSVDGLESGHPDMEVTGIGGANAIPLFTEAWTLHR